MIIDQFETVQLQMLSLAALGNGDSVRDFDTVQMTVFIFLVYSSLLYIYFP